ncbi:40S ribosomal protein eS30 [Aspergillus foveolatus]|uniref:40S ribosomal protein eS30 n=1 Tax=Aspergillus foveolatus TaxID=210207 RepID=UPI003CCE1744
MDSRRPTLDDREGFVMEMSTASQNRRECEKADEFSFMIQVEPQEKKKLPKGRAMKRLKYTRRFVNVTMTGGKRKPLGQFL